MSIPSGQCSTCGCPKPSADTALTKKVLTFFIRLLEIVHNKCLNICFFLWGIFYIWSSWSYSHENGPLRSDTSVSSSHHAKMWGVNHAIFGIIRNAMSYSITRQNVTFFDGPILCHIILSQKNVFFMNIYFHQTQSARANRYHWTLPRWKI